METVAEHLIEAEIAMPPPRRARLPLSTDLLLLSALLLFALFIYGSGRALLEAAKIGWLAAAGQTATAHIQDVLTVPSLEKDKPPIQIGLRYTYVLPFGPDRTPKYGSAHLETAADSAQRLQELQPDSRKNTTAPIIPVFHTGDTLPLRCAEWLGTPLVYPWQAAPTGKVLFLALCGGVVITISVVLLRRIFHWRQRRLILLRYGIATTGTIIHKDARVEDTPRYFVRFGYGAEGEPHEREEQVSMEQWKGFEVGQPVTVLYDPDRRDDAGLYVLVGRG